MYVGQGKKGFRCFFLRRKRARKELLDELEMTREENTLLRKDMEEVKLFLSSQVSNENNISGEMPNVTKGYAAIEKDLNQSAKDNIEVRLASVRNAQEIKFYNKRVSIVDKPESIEANLNPTLAKSDILVTPTINIQGGPRWGSTDPVSRKKIKANPASRRFFCPVPYPAG